MSQVQEERSVRSIVQTVLLYAVGLAVVGIAAYYVSIALIPTPKIGVIYIETPIGGITSDILSREIEYARNNRDIRGVVMVINSPGGSASAGHDMYYQVRKLREDKPVVASMDILAASAAYQIGVGANEIYAKPASLVGNVGVIFSQPQPEVLSERFLTTGPFKSTGGSGTSFLQKLDLLHADFRESVVAERSQAPNPLKISGEEVATGEIWIGIEAKELGLIDELGSKLDAIEAAARLANINNYEVVDIRTEMLADLEAQRPAAAAALQEMYAQLDEEAAQYANLTSEESEWPEFHQLYIPLE